MYSCISIIYFVPTMSRYFYWFIKGDNNFTQIIRTVHEFHHILLKIKVSEDTVTLGTTKRRICFSYRFTISWFYFAHNECFRRMLMYKILKSFDNRWIECMSSFIIKCCPPIITPSREKGQLTKYTSFSLWHFQHSFL